MPETINKDANEPFPVDMSQLAAEHTVTIGFARKLSDGEYGANECSLFETYKFTEELSPTQVDVLRASVIARMKAQVFGELGLKAELSEDGLLMEIAKVFPGAKPAGRTAPEPQRTAPQAPSRAVAPPEYDEEPAQERPAAPRRPPADPDERDWRDYFEDPSKFYDDLNADKPRIKRKSPGAEPCWLSAAPPWVKDWATENGITVPSPPRQGGGGGRTGGGGGYRR